MKKLITGILAILACSCVLTGCKLLPGKTSSDSSDNSVNTSVDNSSSVDASAIEEARDFLDALYKEKNVETREDYTVLKQLTYNDVVYDIEWTVDVTTGVTVVVQDNDVKIDVDENLAEDLDYVLTATLSDAAGNTASVSFERTVLQAPQKVPCPISTTPEEGVAYKFYVFQAANNKAIYINGQMANTYYFATVDTYADGIDVYAEYTETAGQFYIYHNVKALDDNGAETTAKKYINVVQNGTHINATYDDTALSAWVFDAEYGTIVTELSGTKYYLGCDGTYNTVEPQKVVGAGYYMGFLVSEVDKNDVPDSAKVMQEKNIMTFATAYVGDCTATLQEYGSTYPEVRISWSTEDANATVNGNVVTFTDPTATKTVTLTATLTCGEATETATFNVTLVKNDTESILAAAYNLNKGESFANKVTLTGIISAIPTAYDEEYANITITMIVNEDLEQPINCYRLVGTGADVLALGYTVTVTGIITNYNGLIQFTQGCEMTSYVEGSAEDVPTPPSYETPEEIVNALYALDGGKTLPGTYTLEGVITAINTPYDSSFQNVTVTIVVGDMTDKPVYCYRIKGDGADVIKVGDTITVTGSLMHYVYSSGDSSYQFTSGSTLVSYVVGETPVEYEEITIAEALALCGEYTNNQYTTASYYVTGTIVQIANTKYGNLYIADESANLLYVYGLYDENNVRYDSMNPQPAVGDTVKLLSVVGYYNGVQLKNAVVVEHTQNTTVGDVYKAVIESFALTVKQTINEAGEDTLALQGTTYTDVTIAWTSSNSAVASIEGEVITWTLPLEETTVTLTATLTCGESSVTKEFTVKVDPVIPEEITIARALEIGSQFTTNDSYTTEFYYITGTIVEIKSTTYGNMYIADENGTLLYIYGLYDENNTRYDSMATKPVAGDTIKVLSVIGYYNSVQLKNAIVVEHTTTVGNIYKVLTEKNALAVDSKITEAGDITLPIAGTTYTDVVITWESSDSEIVSVNGGIISWVMPSETTTVTLTATLTLGTSTVTKEFTVTVEVLAAGEVSVTTADFETIGSKTSYNAYTSTAGWAVTNAQVVKVSSQITDYSDADAFCTILNGKTTAVGTLTSPTIKGGVSKITFNYANFFSESNGCSLKIEIKDAEGNILATDTLTTNPMAQKTVYDYTWTLSTEIKGDVQIVVTNLSPSNNTGNKDRTALWNFNVYGATQA